MSLTIAIESGSMRQLSVLLCAFLFVSVAAQDQWIGRWKLNPAKSHFQAGLPPKGRTLSFEEVGDGVKGMSDLLDEQGSVHIEFTAKYDGKDVPMRGTPPGLTIAFTKINASTFETLQKTNGQVTLTTRYLVSRDGKVLTASASGVGADGVKFTNVSVYDRQ